jgi:hypothetical protein
VDAGIPGQELLHHLGHRWHGVGGYGGVKAQVGAVLTVHAWNRLAVADQWYRRDYQAVVVHRDIFPVKRA